MRLRACPRCQQAVGEALLDGGATRIDLVQLTPQAELALLLTGGRTARLGPPPVVDRYGVVVGSAPQRLWDRDLLNIRAHPGQGVPLHECARRHGPPDWQLLDPCPRTYPAPDAPCPF